MTKKGTANGKAPVGRARPHKNTRSKTKAVNDVVSGSVSSRTSTVEQGAIRRTRVRGRAKQSDLQPVHRGIRKAAHKGSRAAHRGVSRRTAKAPQVTWIDIRDDTDGVTPITGEFETSLFKLAVRCILAAALIVLVLLIAVIARALW